MKSTGIISHTLNRDVIRTTAARCRERGVTIPTFAQLRNPSTIPASRHLPALRCRPLGREPGEPLPYHVEERPRHGALRRRELLEIPREITGVRARIIGLTGKFFPTGAHKVGAAFGCLVPRLVSGEFDPVRHRAVWPSTGNFCRGGAFDCALLGCTPIAILPEEMSLSGSRGCGRSARRSSPRPGASRTSRRSTTSAGS